MSQSSAIVGAVYSHARSFTIATSGTAVTSQPAAASYNGLAYVPAGVPVPLDVTDSNQVITAITESGTGKLRVIGPITQTARR
jgi:hypothetical protein